MFVLFGVVLAVLMFFAWLSQTPEDMRDESIRLNRPSPSPVTPSRPSFLGTI